MGGFADFYGQTLLHPLALTVTILLALAVLTLPRRFALVPLLISAATMPVAQRLVIAGADFTLLRMLLLAYLARIILRAEWKGFVWNRLDTAIVLWVLSGTAIMTLHYGTSEAFINRLGWAYDVVLIYFTARLVLREWSDVLVLGKSAALLSLPIAVLFILEWTTQYNVFHFFGGVPEFTWVRDGLVRAQGPYAHPIIAGLFWVCLLPMIWMLRNEARTLMMLGTLGVLAVVMTTSSSTPLLSLIAALFGASLFVVRRHRTRMWIGLIVILLLLHFVIMKAPVWHLISRVDMVAGSTGYHRFIIFDIFINNFSDWFATGHSTPRDWGWWMRDITNEFIIQGIRGGLLTLLLFLLVFVRAFANVGTSLSLAADRNVGGNLNLEWRTWLVGVAIFVHVVSFWGISYFGQMNMVLYLQLAAAGAVGVGLGTSSTAERALPIQNSRRACAPTTTPKEVFETRMTSDPDSPRRDVQRPPSLKE